MHILVIAPQPFFIERGTPIAVKLALEVLAEKISGEDLHNLTIELLTYHEGAPFSIPHITHVRSFPLPGLTRMRPGISVKKLLADVGLFAKVIPSWWRARKRGPVLIHAVEESVFFALILNLLFGTKYVYDMDSNLTGQLLDKWTFLSWIKPLLVPIERLAMRRSSAVLPVCESLGQIAQRSGAKSVFVLPDISLLEEEESSELPQVHSLRTELGLAPHDEIILYVGNLEPYQGIDLLLQSFEIVSKAHSSSKLLIVGGNEIDIALYRNKIIALSLTSRVYLLGPRPLGNLGHYLREADILVSPRTLGENTPMKIYSYLHSGRAIVATSLPTHTQVLNSAVAELAAPNADDFSKALLLLLSNKEYRHTLGAQGRSLAEAKYTRAAYSTTLNTAYNYLLEALKS